VSDPPDAHRRQPRYTREEIAALTEALRDTPPAER
jgi:hypothetical protein